MTNKEKLMMLHSDELIDLFDMENIRCDECIAKEVCKEDDMTCRATIIAYLDAEADDNTNTNKDVDTFPEWCQPGCFVYDERCPAGSRYQKVVEISEKHPGLCVLEHDYISAQDINKDVFQARVRELTSVELYKLVGKVITFDNGDKGLCTFYEVGPALITIGDTFYCAEDLIEKGCTVDGKPCKVFEHFENGEWVK